MTASTRTRWAIPALAGILYFSEGMPFGVVTEMLPVYMRVNHVSLREIGFLSTVSLAWSAKLLWSPFVDRFGSYRRWVTAAVAALAILLALTGALAPTGGVLFWTLVSAIALASATQDLAVDAFTIRATPPEILGPVNSIRVAAYRLALIVGGGGLTALAGRVSWRAAFLCGAAVAAVIFASTLLMPDDRGDRGGERRSLLADLRNWISRPRAWTLLAIVFLYRAGEFAIVTMVKPYWVDRGYSPEVIGTITTVVGVTVSIVGAIAGGAFLARVGLWRGLLWIGIAQTASNVGYALVAATNAGTWAIYAASIVENFGYGLGTAAFLAFLMRICDREHAATEYALLTAAYGVARSIVGSAGGFVAQSAGYAHYFALTVMLGIPALLLLPLVRETLDETQDLHA